MAISPRQRQTAVRAAALILRLQKAIANERDKMERSKMREAESRLKQAKFDAEAGKDTEDSAWAGTGGADLVVDDLVGNDEDDEDEDEENVSPDEEDVEQRDEGGQNVDRQQLEQPEEEQVPESEQEQEPEQSNASAQQAQLRDKVLNQVKERVAEEVKRRAMQAVKDAVKKAVTQALAALAKNPYVWLAILIILVLIVIVYFLVNYFGGHTQKGNDLSGGSFETYATKEADSALLDSIQQLRQAGVLIFADGTDKDLDWVGAAGKEQSQLDIRVLSTLNYLGSKWDLIRVRIARSNGPDMTRRGMLKDDGTYENVDSASAFVTGQAIAIDQIGTYSDELASEPKCKVSTDTPIDVGVQEIATEGSLRPAYEQLAADGARLYDAYAFLNNGKPPLPEQNEWTSVKSTNSYVIAQRELTLLVANLNELAANGSAWGLDSQTVSDFEAVDFRSVLQTVGTKSGDALVDTWRDQDAVGKPLITALNKMFATMQKANMKGWYGNTDDDCKLWKAYEARQHVRQLIADLQNMATDPTFTEGETFNSLMVPAQIVVYGIEDASLDDGAPTDVFPPGRMSVTDSGASFDLKGVDGEIDSGDEHFVYLPQDKGVFARPGTIFIYKGERAGLADGVIGAFAPSGALADLISSWDHADLNVSGGDKAGRVTFKGFVEVGF